MLNNRMGALLILALLGLISPVEGADQEGCLFCHRLDIATAGSAVSDLRVSERADGPHAALYCSDCHPDGRITPHAVSPGAARCIGECHAAGTGTTPESHRRAAFGGLTESHRKAAIPASPCMLCHKADDPPGTGFPASARCRGCHPGEMLSLSEGVHSRMAATSPGGGCPSCHQPHPGLPAGGQVEKKVTCKKSGCHGEVTEKMMALGSHGKGTPQERPGRNAARIVFGVVFIVALLPGRFLCRYRTGAKGSGR